MNNNFNQQQKQFKKHKMQAYFLQSVIKLEPHQHLRTTGM